jgi:hypothetical protein
MVTLPSARATPAQAPSAASAVAPNAMLLVVDFPVNFMLLVLLYACPVMGTAAVLLHIFDRAANIEPVFKF